MPRTFLYRMNAIPASLLAMPCLEPVATAPGLPPDDDLFRGDGMLIHHLGVMLKSGEPTLGRRFPLYSRRPGAVHIPLTCRSGTRICRRRRIGRRCSLAMVEMDSSAAISPSRPAC